MKKITLVPIFLLAGSLLVLLTMFTLRGVASRRQTSASETAAASTLIVQQTQDALPTATLPPSPTTAPTVVPSPTIIPTSDTPQATPTEKVLELIPGCDVAAFVADVTVPDGKEFDPGKKFTKTWRILNDGTCTWNNMYRLTFVSGDKMSGPNNQPLTALEVEPGKIIEISVELTAPQKPGKYRGYWGFKNTNGVEFGIGSQNNPIYVEIVVPE
jgi:hypothetical protein